MVVALTMVMASMPNLAEAAEGVEIRVKRPLVQETVVQVSLVEVVEQEAVLAVLRMVAWEEHGVHIPLAVEVKPILVVTTLAIPMNLAVATEAEEGQTLMKAVQGAFQAVAVEEVVQLLAITKGAVLVLEVK